MIMAVDATKEIQFEIVHIVGYSRLLINEQSQQRQNLEPCHLRGNVAVLKAIRLGPERAQ
jgi:hypothetical protein